MKLWQDKIRAIEPYVPGEQPKIKNIIKLNTNESPFPPSPAVEVVLRDFDYKNLRLYPSIDCTELKQTLGSIYNVKNEEIFLGNGSDEVLALAFMTFFNSDKPVVFPDITYSFYDVWCKLFKIPYIQPALDESFRIKKEDYYPENGGCIITNPNAPTGIALPLSEIEDIIEHNMDSVVIIDEAYIDFGGASAVDLIHKYENVVVVQTYSKSRALAGIRLGYAMADKELIAAMDAVKNSFNSYTINSLTNAVGNAAAKDEAYFNSCVEKIKSAREWTVVELDKLGFKTLPSSSNFIFTTNPNIPAEKLYSYLRDNNIIVRYFNKPRIDQYMRITIGTMEQMEALVNAVKKYC